METIENVNTQTSYDLPTTDSVIFEMPHSADSSETFQGCSSNNLAEANKKISIEDKNNVTQSKPYSQRGLWNESCKTHFSYGTGSLHTKGTQRAPANFTPNYLNQGSTKFNTRPTDQSLITTKDKREVATMEDSQEQIKDKSNDGITKFNTGPTDHSLITTKDKGEVTTMEDSQEQIKDKSNDEKPEPSDKVKTGKSSTSSDVEMVTYNHNQRRDSLECKEKENNEDNTSSVQTIDANLQNYRNLGENVDKKAINNHEEEKQPLVTFPEKLRNCDNQPGYSKPSSSCNSTEANYSNAKIASTTANSSQQPRSVIQTEMIQKMLQRYSREENVAIALGILNHYNGLCGNLKQSGILAVTSDVSHSEEHYKSMVELKATGVTKSESERNKHFIEQINSLSSEIGDLQQISDNYKYLYQHLVKENSKIIGAIQTVYQELQETQRLPEPNPFWSVISNRQKLEADTTFGTVQKFCAYIKLLHEDQLNQEAAIKSKTEENQKLQLELADANKTILDWKKTFEEKRKKQIQIVQEQDRKLEQLKKSCEVAEIQHQKKMKDASRLREQQKQEYEAKLELQGKTVKNLQDAKNNLLTENAALKQSLDQSRVELQNASVKFKGIKLQLDNEFKISEGLRSDLVNIKTAICKQDTTLATEKENFSKSLNKISTKIVNYTSQISLEDIKRQTESKVIEQALKRIRDIQEDVKKYEHEISTFQGNSSDKVYLNIKEMLIRAVEKLDTIESQKKKEILFHRKEAIDYVKYLQGQLERSLSTRQ